MTLKVRVIPCLDVKDGRRAPSAAASAVGTGNRTESTRP
jgi:imidazole glycerol phosphate synthase subunit HisF